jgi:hypothetical protein
LDRFKKNANKKEKSRGQDPTGQFVLWDLNTSLKSIQARETKKINTPFKIELVAV